MIGAFLPVITEGVWRIIEYDVRSRRLCFSGSISMMGIVEMPSISLVTCWSAYFLSHPSESGDVEQDRRGRVGARDAPT